MDGADITFEKTYKIGPSNYILMESEAARLRDCYARINEKQVKLSRLELSILGTAATVPTMANNVQSFCISILDSSFRIIIDCGNNTFY